MESLSSSHLLEPNNTKTRMDVESLQTSARPRRCLDTFVVMSVVFLFVVLTAVTAGGVMVAMELRSEVQHVRPSFQGTDVGDDPVYKMQNFAYLEATPCELKDSTMKWAPVDHLTGNSVGKKFSFDSTTHELKTKQEGRYFMYLDLNLTCTSVNCSAGLLTVRVKDHKEDQLSCTVELPGGAVSTPVSKKCWTVARLDGETRLTAQMTVSKNGLKNWKLVENSSGLGMFLVA